VQIPEGIFLGFYQIGFKAVGSGAIHAVRQLAGSIAAPFEISRFLLLSEKLRAS
jgi:hypothetical protein